jgi:hypothetical protein
MPYDKGLPSTQIAPEKDDQQYGIYLGREIYDQFTISGLNKLPVTMLADRACLGAEPSTEPPVSIYDVCESLLVDGGQVYTLIEGGWVRQNKLLVVQDNFIAQELDETDALDVPLVREWHLNGDKWSFVVYKDYWDQPERLKKGGGTKPASEVICIPNGMGILYPVQWTYQRLEEIRWSIRQETNDFALSILVMGPIGTNPQDAISQLENGSRIAKLMSGPGTSVERVGDSRIPEQLANEYKELAIEYFNNCHILDMSRQPERPVGLDLQLRLEPQMNFVEGLRRKISEVMAVWGVDVEYKKLTTISPQDKQLEVNTLILAKQAGWIDDATAKAVIDKLF